MRRDAERFMYDDRFYPFYMTYGNPLLYSGEKMHEDEFELMKSYYPDTARKIQEKVERECEFQDYEGSRLYDEHPDKFMIYCMAEKIRRDMESSMEVQAMPGNLLDDLIQVLLYQEISRRRCRRHRCRGYF